MRKKSFVLEGRQNYMHEHKGSDGIHLLHQEPLTHELPAGLTWKRVSI